MTKNLLFIMPGLSSGGGERSLVNLLSQVDYDEYQVDLFLLNHDGLFMEFIPQNVRLLPLPDKYQLFTLAMWKSTSLLLFKGKFGLAYHRAMFALKNRLFRSTALREQYSWKHMSKFLDTLAQPYDTVIGFMEKTSIYFSVDKVQANTKVGWIHIDYDQLGMDPHFDVSYFKQLDHIVTVSEECADILKNRFPHERDKISVIHNIVSPEVIKQLADQHKHESRDAKDEEISILSIGRLHSQKAFELAIEACRKLVDKGYPVQWRIIGEGEERQKLTDLIQANGLENHFTLLGLKSNPYPYLKQADLYVQTSRFEGKSIAIDEAKILNKPIVVTRFSTAKDQIEDGVDGLIVDMNAEAVAAGIETLIQDKALRVRITDRLAQLSLGTEEEIHKFYKLLV